MCKNFSINGSQLKHVSLLKIYKSHEQSSSDESKKRKKRVWVFFLTPLVYEKNIFHSFLWKGSQEYFIKVFKSIVSEFAT